MKMFIYGTLKKDKPNHYLLENSEFIEYYITKDVYPMIDSGRGYPYLLNKPGIGKHIKGEIYEISNITKRQLDILEGVPKYYYLGDIDGFKTYFKTENVALNDKYLMKEW